MTTPLKRLWGSVQHFRERENGNSSPVVCKIPLDYLGHNHKFTVIRSYAFRYKEEKLYTILVRKHKQIQMELLRASQFPCLFFVPWGAFS